MVDIIHRIGIKAPATKVYEALATAQGRGRKDGKEIGQMDFEMTKLEANREVRWRFLGGPPEWVGTDATFQLTQDGDTTVLLFGHRNWREAIEFTAHCSMKWAVFLLSLRDFVETGKGRPSPDDLKIDNWN